MFKCRKCSKEHATRELRLACEVACGYICGGCECGPGEKHRIVGEKPDDEQIEAWVCDSVCEATDGCTVEPDGTCPHGHRSWLLVLGIM